MKIKELNIILEKALKEPNNDQFYSEYIDSVEKYIKSNKITSEFISIVINGMDIDNGSCYFDYLEEISKKELDVEWRIIRENKIVKDEKSEKALALLVGLLYLSVIKCGNMESILGNIITAIEKQLSKPLNNIIEKYNSVFYDYFADQLPNDFEFPKWNTIKIVPEVLQKFTDITLKLETLNNRKYISIRKWLNEGKQHAISKIEKKTVESQIPDSKIEDLKKIVDHYTNIETQLKNITYEKNSLNNKISELNKEIEQLNMENIEQMKYINQLEKEVKELRMSVHDAKKEIEERKKLNEVQVQYREETQITLLQEISQSVKAEFADFFVTQNENMTEILGEIYREKLKNIASALEKKGIMVNE